MTPRQIIQHISKRRHLKNVGTEVHFKDEEYQDVCGNTSNFVNKFDFETNSEIKNIKQSKHDEYLCETSNEQSRCCLESRCKTSMYPTADYLQGNAILTKPRKTESPTRFYDFNKERQRNTPNVSFTTWYTTIRNADEATRRTKSQKLDVVPKSKTRRVERADSWPHDVCLASNVSNIRGMAKKIHDKSVALANIAANENERRNKDRYMNEKHIGKAKQFKKSYEKEKRSEIWNRGTDDKDSSKRIRLHIYVPTAEMNS